MHTRYARCVPLIGDKAPFGPEDRANKAAGITASAGRSRQASERTAVTSRERGNAPRHKKPIIINALA